jgi:protein-L-isoaspartate(D-aspartate) O-methyltransferase
MPSRSWPFNAAHPRVEAAFAAVRREAFLGPGPWPILHLRGYVTTPDDDPVYLYQDLLVGIIQDRGLNNGRPSWHAMLIARADARPGEHVVHVVAGTGYYAAILAHMVGDAGRVTAIELDAGLAERLAAKFPGQPNVRAVPGDGAQVDFGAADVIYVNAGATRPADLWLDRLNDGGRLILPLIADNGLADWRRGAVFRIERRGDEYLAKWIAAGDIVPCEGARDAASQQALSAAFAKGRGLWERVTRLRRSGDVPDEQCWLKAPDWCLAYD